MHARAPLLAVIAHSATVTNRALVRACTRSGVRAAIVSPAEAPAALAPGDAALGRLDVLGTLDGPEPGLWELRQLERRGVRVLNPAPGLAGAHDKVTTAVRLSEAGLPHPRTVHVCRADRMPPLPLPLVLKPRFGSWGRDVLRCQTEVELAAVLAQLSRRPWFARTGAVAQPLVPCATRDVRVVVAGGRAVGAIERIAAPGEWRTNIALGASRRPVEPPGAAAGLAVAAAAAVGLDLAGVDLLPLPHGGWAVLEVNGAVDFTLQYRRGADVFAAAAAALLDRLRSPNRLHSLTAP